MVVRGSELLPCVDYVVYVVQFNIMRESRL